MFKMFQYAFAISVLWPMSASGQSDLIEEVVVTATKRASTLQEIPIAVSVTTAAVIEEAQIQDIADLQSVVPSLSVRQGQSSINTNYSIRGFGNGGNNPGIEPSVGVFIDGVYRSRVGSSISDFPNLERVEVLSGPQSTLFGKNASAGVISVVTKKPTGDRSGKVSASIGNLSSLVLKGYYDGAISSNTAFSVAASINNRDGYNTNLITGSQLNDRNREAIRAQLLLNPTDSIQVRLIADYDQLEELCCGVTNLVAGPTSAAIQAIGGRIIANTPFTTDSFVNVDPNNEVENSGLSAQIDKDFDSFNLTSITSYRETDSFYNIDADFTSSDIIQNELTNEFNTFTQEFRLTSTSADRLDWMVGGFYFDESVKHKDDLPFGSGFRPYVDILGQGIVGLAEQIVGASPGTFYREGSGFTHDGSLDNQALSLFGQFDFAITESLRATLGLNFTKDEKEITLTQTRANEFSDLDLVAVGNAFFTSQTGLPLTTQTLAAVAQSGPAGAALAQATGALTSSAARGLQFTPRFPGLPNGVEDNTSDDDELTYTFRLAYDINDSVNVYGGYSTGFKATSWNLSRDSRPTRAQIGAVQAAGFGTPNLVSGTRFASPEKAKVFEVGMKVRFARSSFNLAIFDQTIDGFQSNDFTGNGFNLTNAGEQSVKGFEFDLSYYPIDSVQLKVAGTFLDALYDDYENAGRNALTGEVFSLSGTVPGDIPEINLSLSAHYKFQIGRADAFVRGDYFYEEETPVDDSVPQNPIINLGQFSRETKNVNLATGVITDSGLGLTLWLRNATNHDTLTGAFPGVAQPNSFSGYRNQPRTYGITLTKDF